ncbi:hypothetical protein Y032_0969g3249 [Ancylostoma ceylanicum]|uniref:UV-stimulated scaffold protein A C-terminal domain-containing protein n=1 Tax=Ancylostoma ceylanicum TaxID=53326 RepID=A0A016W897_9BILA|nr:hypothetical protein Y032_0969g3249 [Ancylostoma ceylanicum]
MADDLLRLLRLSTSKLVNEAVNASSGIVSTDSRDFKRLKSNVRANEDVIPDYVDYLFLSLKCYTHFLLAILYLLSELLLLVCETDPLRFPLPGPIAEAKQLKIDAIKMVKNWLEKFGPGYEKLNFVGDYLKESKAVDFDSATAELLAERTRKALEEQRAAEKLQKIAANVRRKLAESKGDIDRCLASAETALSIVVPVFGATVEVNDTEAKSSGAESVEMQSSVHGYAPSDTISIVLTSLAPEVTVNEDNEVLLESIRDAKVMLDVYRNNIVSWQRKINGATGVEDLMRDLTDLKRRIEQQCGKIDELKLKPKRKSRKGAESSESEESDLEDVPEKQLEDFVPPDEVPRYIMERVQQLEKEEQPCCSKSLEPSESSSNAKNAKHNSTDGSEPKPKIPVVPFGPDLLHWGEQRTVAPTPRNNADCHRFWRPPDDDDKCVANFYDASV